MDSKPLPFVETTIARRMLSRMRITHEERAITVIQGPWGIGKTTAIDAFAAANEGQCAVIKVEPGANRRGASAGRVLQIIVEALRRRLKETSYGQLSTSSWTLRCLVNDTLARVCPPYNREDVRDESYVPRFTFIFDEAQYLSKEAIELLRFWNDRDRTSTPFPVGLIFVGNNEFAMEESLGKESVLSGAVRSRLLFEVPLEYEHICDTDLTLFAQSRGVSDPAALRDFVGYFSQPRVPRDLRNAERLLKACRTIAGDGPISPEIVREVVVGV